MKETRDKVGIDMSLTKKRRETMIYHPATEKKRANQNNTNAAKNISDKN